MFNLILFIIGLSSVTAHAACTSPAGDTGHMTYTSGVMKVCTGSSWINTLASAGAGCGGTAAGTLNYSAGDLRFCNGANWYSMKGSALSSCAGTAAGTHNWDGTGFRFCDGTNWYATYTTLSWYSGISYSTDHGGALYGSCLAPTEANMNSEFTGNSGTWGSANNSGGSDIWIEADLGSNRTVSAIRVGGSGPAVCWASACDTHWNLGSSSIMIEAKSGNIGSAYSTVANGNAIVYSNTVMQNIYFAPTTARFIRIRRAASDPFWLCTGQFRIGN